MVAPAAFACAACSAIELAVFAAAALRRPPDTFDATPLISVGDPVAISCPLL
jgi:hypothetical protein